jgi:hypothetical protein
MKRGGGPRDYHINAFKEPSLALPGSLILIQATNIFFFNVSNKSRKSKAAEVTHSI